jgi:hypothetical protein
MTPTAWLAAVLISGFVWGGFVALLIRAVRAERKKQQERRAPS